MPHIILNNIPFDRADLSDEIRNRTLGQFMTAWSQVEVVCGFLFRELTGIKAEVSSIVFDRIGVREQLEIVAEFAELCDPPLDTELKGLLERTQKVSVARNKIVHASWGSLDGEASRFWQGITSAHLNEIMSSSQKGKSLLEKYVFTVTNLSLLAGECVCIREGLIEKLDIIHSNSAHKARVEVEAQFGLRKECFELRGEVQRLRMQLQRAENRQSDPQ